MIEEAEYLHVELVGLLCNRRKLLYRLTTLWTYLDPVILLYMLAVRMAHKAL